MPHTDLRPLVVQLLTARDRANAHDFEKALAALRRDVGLDTRTTESAVAILEEIRAELARIDMLITLLVGNGKPEPPPDLTNAAT